MRYDDHGITEMLARKQEPPAKSVEAPVTQRLPGRLTIGGLMVAIAVAALLLALPAEVGVIMIALSIPGLTIVGARWLVVRRHRRLATFIFWLVAILTNLFVACSCVTPNMNSTTFSMIPPALLVVAAPTTAALGRAWVVLLNTDEVMARRSRDAGGFAVLVLAVLPIWTLWTLWPLRLAFIAARPDLERLANQVAAGMPVRFPRHAGLFKVTAPAIAPASGSVGLRLETSGAPDTGFVRLRPGAIRNTAGPFLGVNFDVYLGGGWWYRG
jgi:hypothetical protein